MNSIFKILMFANHTNRYNFVQHKGFVAQRFERQSAPN